MDISPVAISAYANTVDEKAKRRKDFIQSENENNGNNLTLIDED